MQKLMSEQKSKIEKSIRQYFKEVNMFVIPNYQRGFKWGVPDKNGNCAVRILMDDLLTAFKNSHDNNYYIQGVTVFEKEENAYLIDGQQRTTTFLLLLNELFPEDKSLIIDKENKEIKLNYAIREDTQEFLQNVVNETAKIENPPENRKNSQDIYYLKEAILLIREKLPAEGAERDNFKKFILDNVKLFYIIIDENQATKTFSMLNGNKAFMKVEELIKAAMLSKASRVNTTDDNSNNPTEWEVNVLRSKYAREWDSWLYWWNKKEVKDFYKTSGKVMGLLIEYFMYSEQEGKENTYSNNEKNVLFTYKNFEELVLKDRKTAKQNFKKLRDLQKQFEDWFNHYESHNYLGLILNSGIPKKEALLYFLKLDNKKEEKETLKNYAKWALVGATHKEIENKNQEILESKAVNVITQLSEKEVYGNYNIQAARQLLRRNVEMDNRLERKFDFALFGEKSLEHIHPQSKAESLNFLGEENLSVHSIGNLVLITKNDNSSFGNKDFDDKKKAYFEGKNAKWSLKFLHSVSVFSQNQWDRQSIFENQIKFIRDFKTYYELTQPEK